MVASVGFGVKVVERNGSSLRSLFPLNNLWEGAPCGREECIPCTQGAEEPPRCNKASMVYENVCRRCNRGAGGKKELQDVVEGSIYVGESSRTLYERSREHQKDWESRKEKSHIAKHQGAAHKEGEEPDFIIKPVRFYKTALSRQIGEAVRIRRRGGAGAILNSKSEYSRCKIPRLVLEDVDEEEEQRQEQQDREDYVRMVEEQANCWGATALQERKEDDMKQWRTSTKTTRGSKRIEMAPEELSRRRKRRRFLPIEDSWGLENTTMVEDAILLPPESSALLPTLRSSGTEDNSSLAREGTKIQLSMKQFLAVDVRLGTTGVNTQPSYNVEYKEMRLEVKDGCEDKGTIKKDENEDNLRETVRGSNETPSQDPLMLPVMKNGDTTEVTNICTVTPSLMQSMAPVNNGEEVIGRTSPVTRDSNASNEQDGVSEEVITCKPDKKGYCRSHGTKMNIQVISSKKWSDMGGGRGYGWKYGKVKKYVCRKKLEAEKTDRIPSKTTSTYNEMGLGDRFRDFQLEGTHEHTTTTQRNKVEVSTWGLALESDV